MRAVTKRCLVVSVFIPLLILSGCAAKAPPVNPALEAAAYSAMERCYAAKETRDKAAYENMTSDQALLAMAIDGLSAAANKGGPDPCKMLTNNDLQKVAMEETTKRIGIAGSLGGKVVTGGTVALLGGEVASVLKSGFSAAGDHTSFEGDATVSDSYNTTTSTGNVETTEVVATTDEEEITADDTEVESEE